MELFKDIQTGCEADSFQPLLAYLRSKKSGRTTPPYFPQWKLLSLQKLCELALLWQEAGFGKEASELASWLLPLEKFPTLWCPEKEFDEKAAADFFARIKTIELVSGHTPDFDVAILKQGAIHAAFTLSGNGTSLGVIHNADVEIRALGPQSGELKFGIQGNGMNGWARCFAMPEVWMEMKREFSHGQIKLDLRFVGLQSEMPFHFAFYVKAGSCQIGNEVLKPKSLRRYNGEGNRVQFNRTVIESASTHKIQVIPLAGEGCFWNCEFLASFEIHPFAPQVSFLIS